MWDRRRGHGFGGPERWLGGQWSGAKEGIVPELKHRDWGRWFKILLSAVADDFFGEGQCNRWLVSFNVSNEKAVAPGASVWLVDMGEVKKLGLLDWIGREIPGIHFAGPLRLCRLSHPFVTNFRGVARMVGLLATEALDFGAQ